jgi:lysozyme
MPRHSRILPAVLTASVLAVAGIAVHEAYRGAAYDDGVGVQTIGLGTTTRADGSPIRPGDRITPERAIVRLAHDVERMQVRMRDCIGPVPLYQHEWDAYVSLTYNIGEGAFCRSTLVRRLQQQPPDYYGACAQILRWTRAGGRELRGLVTRRQAEYRICTGQAPALPPLAPEARP